MVALVAATAGLILYAANDNQNALIAAGDSEVSFIADVTGTQTPGQFSDTQVTASIDLQNPSNSSIVAVVNTASLSSENSQVEGSLPDPDWFDVTGYPQSRFESTSITADADGKLQVEGNLTLKATTQSISFAMSLSNEEEKQVARGEFVIDRREFNVGAGSQSSDEYVGFDVIVRFRFDINPSTGAPPF